MFRTSLHSNKINIMSDKLIHRTLILLHNDTFESRFNYVSNKLNDPRINNILHELTINLWQLLPFYDFLIRLCILYIITDEQFHKCKKVIKQNARDIFYIDLNFIFDFDTNLIEFEPLYLIFNGLKARFNDQLEIIEKEAINQRMMLEQKYLNTKYHSVRLLNYENSNCLKSNNLCKDTLVFDWFCQINYQFVIPFLNPKLYKSNGQISLPFRNILKTKIVEDIQRYKHIETLVSKLGIQYVADLYKVTISELEKILYTYSKIDTFSEFHNSYPLWNKPCIKFKNIKKVSFKSKKSKIYYY